MLKAGFLPLYLDLYDQIDPQMRSMFGLFVERIKAILRDEVELVESEIATDERSIRAFFQVLSVRNADLVVTIHLSYSPSLLVAEALRDFGRPILILDTSISYSLDPEDDHYLMLNHGIHGVMDLTSVLTANDVEFKVIAGHPDDESFTRKITNFLRGLELASLFGNQRIGITGKPFEGMGDFAVDFNEMEKKYGVEVVPIEPGVIAKRAAEIADDEVKDQIERDNGSYAFESVPDQVHENSVRIFLALKALLSEEQCTGYTMNFQHITDRFAAPFYACSRLMSERIGYAGEGDILTACLGRPLNRAAPRAMFSEMFCADWKEGVILMSHMGETDVRFCRSGFKPRLVPKKALFNKHDSLIFLFETGNVPVTVVNIAGDPVCGFRLIAYTAELLDTPVYDSIGSPHFVMKPPMPVEDFLEWYASCGGGHHLYVADGSLLPHIQEMARNLNFGFYAP